MFGQGERHVWRAIEDRATFPFNELKCFSGIEIALQNNSAAMRHQCEESIDAAE